MLRLAPLARIARTAAPRVSAAPAATAARSFAASSINRADPFPLPFDPALAAQHAAERATRNPEDVIEEWAMPPPLDRTGEAPEVTRARLVYQTRKRGTLEADLLLSTFARDFLPEMSVEEMGEFDKLLDEPDWDIYYWAIEKRPAPERWAGSAILAKLQKHARNEGKVVRMMPDLREVQKAE